MSRGPKNAVDIVVVEKKKQVRNLIINKGSFKASFLI